MAHLGMRHSNGIDPRPIEHCNIVVILLSKEMFSVVGLTLYEVAESQTV